MTEAPRRASVRALAKLNLGLKILHKRPDGFHELRTVFQTISLADRIGIEFSAAAATEISLDGNIDIPDNLVTRAARLALEEMRISGRVRFELTKCIPMGAGLGGGSSDAAAVLLALPVLAGGYIPLDRLIELAGTLGSDVPFFLLGGTAVALGRGTELYPLPNFPARNAVVVAPGIHVSTPEAYRALGRELTSATPQNMISIFQSVIWKQAGESEWGPEAAFDNDFETVVFEQYPQLRTIKQQIVGAGARAAALSGSGSALFGIFAGRSEARRALQHLRNEKVFEVSFVTRQRYRSLWQRQLEPHLSGREWPPRSRYS